MEDILRQRFNYAMITPLRNYTPMSLRQEPIKKRKRPTQQLDGFDLLAYDDSNYDYDPSHNGILLAIPRKEDSKYKRKFFYNNGDDQRYSLLYAPSPFFENRSNEFGGLFSHDIVTQFYTDKDKHIKRYFSNPFSSIELTTIEHSIVRHDNKITFKTYRHIKTRGVNCKFFRKRSVTNSLTFNTDTGNFTTVRFEKSAHRNMKKIRTNSFGELEFFFNRSIDRKGSLSCPNKTLNDHFSDVLNGEVFLNKFINVLGLKCNAINSDKVIMYSFINKFVEVKKIKVPNDYIKFLTKYYPTEKFFKKNDRKLISSITDMFKIKSKITNKILHECPDVNLLGLIGICQLFGDNFQKYIGNINKDQFQRKQEQYYLHEHYTRQSILEIPRIDYNLTHKEKENILGVINTHPSGVTSDCIRTIRDHLRMINTLRELTVIEFKAKNFNDFNREHSEYSKLISLIRKAFVNEFVFNEKMTNDVEKPIIHTDKDGTQTIYHPIILRREEEYSEEGSYVHHCVGGYSNKETSIIVSLRNYENGDRVTSEFNVKDGKCIQSKYYHNAPPPFDYIIPLEVLYKKIEKHAKLEQLKYIEKLKVRTKINGVEVPIDFELNENGNGRIHHEEEMYF